jgi:hypothetical protein
MTVVCIVSSVSFALSRHRWLCRTSDLHICDWLELLDNVQRNKYLWVSWIKLCIEMRMFLLQIWNAVGFIWGKRGTAKCKILVWVKTTRIVTVKSISFGCKLKFLSVQATFKEFHIFLYSVSDFPDNKANTNGTKCPLRNLWMVCSW